jgi:hypothetical protein
MQGAPHDREQTPEAVIRERCQRLGVPTIQVDNAGLVIEEPTEPGLVGLFLQSQTLSDHIVRAVAVWNNQREPRMTELFPGCWAIPLPVSKRRRRGGYLLAILLGPVSLHTEDFEKLCSATLLDPSATRSTMQKLAIWMPENAASFASLLQWSNTDLSAGQEQERTIAGFTSHLTEAYETVELLYELGRCMTDLGEPTRFGAMAIDRLHRITEFGWIAAAFPDTDVLPVLADCPVIWAGRRLCDDATLVDAAARFLKTNGSIPTSVIAGFLEGLPAEAGPQIVLQPVTRKGHPVGLLMAGCKGGDDPQVSSYDTRLLEAAAGYLSAFIENAALYSEQHATFLGTLKAMTAAIDAKDRYTCGHSERVAYLSRELALLAGFDKDRAERVHIAGLVHDVGKIGVPESVLCKPGRLTDEEFDLIKLHPEIGHTILKDIPLFQDLLPGVLHHHERWDGGGYPYKIKGEQTPLIARIIGIADTFDAMSSTRSYRPAMPREKVLAEIARCAGAQFDPRLAELFVTLDFSEYDRMLAERQVISVQEQAQPQTLSGATSGDAAKAA